MIEYLMENEEGKPLEKEASGFHVDVERSRFYHLWALPALVADPGPTRLWIKEYGPLQLEEEEAEEWALFRAGVRQLLEREQALLARCWNPHCALARLALDRQPPLPGETPVDWARRLKTLSTKDFEAMLWAWLIEGQEGRPLADNEAQQARFFAGGASQREILQALELPDALRWFLLEAVEDLEHLPTQLASLYERVAPAGQLLVLPRLSETVQALSQWVEDADPLFQRAMEGQSTTLLAGLHPLAFHEAPGLGALVVGAKIPRSLAAHAAAIVQAREEKIDFLKALADPQRYHILLALEQSEQTVKGLASALDLSQATVSHHLSVLRSQGLVEGRGGACQVQKAGIYQKLQALAEDLRLMPS